MSVYLLLRTSLTYQLTSYGINSQIVSLAYDPVQSLLAVGTSQSKYGSGQVYVFGRARVQTVFSLSANTSATNLHFVGSKLICLDSSSHLTVFSLDTSAKVASYSISGRATAIATDPTLDYAFIGNQIGDIYVYDLARSSLAPLRIPNQWGIKDPKLRISVVESLQFHPRDIGTLLIGYTHGAVIYSFKQNKSIAHFLYELPRGAPGGDATPGTLDVIRRPRLLQAIWHPTGTFILTSHEDGSLVFWDSAQSRIVSARTLDSTQIHLPGASVTSLSRSAGPKEPIVNIAWCANQDPDDTALVVAGGMSRNAANKGLTLLELGRTPVYATSSWDILSKHFDSPRRQQTLPIPPNTSISTFCFVPRASPHFSGCQDPVALFTILTSGEMLTSTFPSGNSISPTNQLHPSLTFVHPFISSLSTCSIPREQWLGLLEQRSKGPSILRGGSSTAPPSRRSIDRTIILAAHANGTVRIWDAGQGDQVENHKMLQVDICPALGRSEHVDISHCSFSGANAEFAAGLKTGEVLVFRWGENRYAGREARASKQNPVGQMVDVSDRASPDLKVGLLPLTLLSTDNGGVTALKVSDIGFVAAAYEGGRICVIDLRGPAMIYSDDIQRFAASSQNTARRKGVQAVDTRQYITCLEFSVMTLEGEGYSSILLHAGTTNGHIATFKILPDQSGRYTVQYAGSNDVAGRVVSISPIDTTTGAPAAATPAVVAGLAQGTRIEGAIVAVTQTEVRVFRPPLSKGAHKTFDNGFCDAANVVRCSDRGYAVVGVFGDGTSRAFSIPALREIGGASVGKVLDMSRTTDAHVTPCGNIVAWTGPSELAVLSVWGSGRALWETSMPSVNNVLTRHRPSPRNNLLDPQAVIPPRPTISNMQWLSGTQYVTPADMDILIGGPSRAPSPGIPVQGRSDPRQQQTLPMRNGRPDAALGTTADPVAGQTYAATSAGYAASLRDGFNERTARLGTVGENVESLQTASAAWADSASKFVAKQKRNMVMGAVKGRLGL